MPSGPWFYWLFGEAFKECRSRQILLLSFSFFVFCLKKPFLIYHFQFFSKANMKIHRARSLLYFFYDSFSKFRMIDVFPFFIFYNHILRSSVFLLSSVLIPYGDCFIMNRIPEFFHNCDSSVPHPLCNRALVPHLPMSSSISMHFREFQAATDTV